MNRRRSLSVLVALLALHATFGVPASAQRRNPPPVYRSPPPPPPPPSRRMSPTFNQAANPSGVARPARGDSSRAAGNAAASGREPAGGFVKRLAPAVGGGTGSFGSATGKRSLGAGAKAESAGGHSSDPGHANAALASKFGGKPASPTADGKSFGTQVKDKVGSAIAAQGGSSGLADKFKASAVGAPAAAPAAKGLGDGSQRVDGRQDPRPRPRPKATDSFGQAAMTAEKQAARSGALARGEQLDVRVRRPKGAASGPAPGR